MNTDNLEPHDDLQIDNLPNRLTIMRVLLVPVVVGCLWVNTTSFFISYHPLLGWIAGWTFTAASITDFFDGYIARKRGIVTIFGSFLDPIADKFLVVSSLIMLDALNRIPALIVVILVLREIFMTSLRLLASNEGLSVPVNQFGKWKTTMQMIGIPMLMANGNLWIIPLPQIGIVAIYVACFLSLYSAGLYSFGLIKKLKLNRQQKKSLKRQQGS